MNIKNVQNEMKSSKYSKDEYPKTHLENLVKTNILGISFTNASKEVILEYIFSVIQNSDECYYVVTPNPEMIIRCQKDIALSRILNNAEVSLCDGVGVLLASRLLGAPLSSRFTGVDAVTAICRESAKRAVTIGLVGGEEGVAEKTAECLRRENPNIRIIFTTSEWQEKYTTTPVDILFVAFGFPKQETWIAEHLGKIPVKMMMGVGGSFDYISGNVPRAPKFIRALGCEWLFRLVRQPWRWKRQVALVEFMWLVIREKVLRMK